MSGSGHTVRAAITAAQESLDNVRPEDELTLALAALECAIELLDASGREVGAFHEREPYCYVLDPLPRQVAATLAT
jgi:hypothetical protein